MDTRAKYFSTDSKTTHAQKKLIREQILENDGNYCAYCGRKLSHTNLTMDHNYQVLHEQHERGYTYSIKTIRDLESKLEIARKALKELWQATHYDTDGYLGKTIQHALEQITHDNSEKPNSQEHKE